MMATTLPTIDLSQSSSSKSKQNILSKALDIISAPLSQPKTTFTKGLSAGAEAVKKSRSKIRSGDTKEALKVVGTTLLSTATAASAVLGGGTAAGRTVATSLGKKVAVAAAKKPLLTLAGVGLATTAGGRKLLTEIPKKAFEGGRIAGKVLGGEDTGLSNVGKALAAGGILGGAAIGGKMLYDKIVGGKEAVDVLPKQIGVADPSVSPLLSNQGISPQGMITGSSQAPGAIPQTKSQMGAPVIVQVTI
jgi:hypothetical protein